MGSKLKALGKYQGTACAYNIKKHKRKKEIFLVKCRELKIPVRTGCANLGLEQKAAAEFRGDFYSLMGWRGPPQTVQT